MNKFVKSINHDKLFDEYYQTISGIAGLSPKQSKVFIDLMKLQFNYKPDPLDKEAPMNILSTEARQTLCHKHSVSGSNLSHMLSNMRRKGLITYNYDELFVNRGVMPELIGDRLQITFIIKLDESA